MSKKKFLSAAFLDQGLVSLSNFSTSVILTRNLGLELFGAFTISWIIILLAQNIQLSFILTPILNIGPRLEGQEEEDFFNNSFTIQILFSLFSILIIILLFILSDGFLGVQEKSLNLLICFCMTLLTTQIHEFGRRYFYAKRKRKKILDIDLARYISQIAGLVTLSFLGIRNISLVYLVISISSLLSILLNIKRLPKIVRFSKTIKKTFKENWVLAKWLIPSSIIYWISQNLFLLFANKFMGLSSVGLIKVIQNLFSFTNIGFQAIDNWGYVEASRIFNQSGIRELNIFTKKLILYIGMTTFLIVLLIFLSHQSLMLNIFNVNAKGYGLAILVYSFSPIISSLNAPFRYYVASIGKTNLNFASQAVGLFVVAIITYPLIKNFGLVGSVGGITIMQLSLLLTYIYNIKYRAIRK